MADNKYRILTINPGSSSTKLGLFEDKKEILSETVKHSQGELRQFANHKILEQLDFRSESVMEFLRQQQIDIADLSAIVARGGLLKPLESGTYTVNDAMVRDLSTSERGEHASNLGALIAERLTRNYNIPAFVVDPVSVDEWQDVARYSGLAGLDRECLSHALNTKAVCKRYAGDAGNDYTELRLIVAHLGSGFSISAHEQGRMIDTTNSMQEGGFSMQRSGTLPVMKLVDMCYSGRYSHNQMKQMIFGQGGVFSYLGVDDFKKFLGTANPESEALFDAMVYQICKDIGAMACVLSGDVHAILLTGGLTHSAKLVTAITKKISWIAPVHSYAGEDELRALAEGGLRVLKKEETVRIYS